MGAVFCDQPHPHGAHQAPTDTGRCPGRGLQEADAPAVCEACGRTEDQPPAKDCEQPEWHQADPDEPAPEPALRGDDLVRHLRSRLTYAEDQVALATQLIMALLLQREEPLARITDAELTGLDDGRHALQTWRDPATLETVYRVVTR